MAAVTLSEITKVYPNGVKAVTDLNLEVSDGEFLVLVGPSGCGKSTALRLIAGLEDITAGELRIGDRLVNDLGPKDRDIAMVFQNYALYPHMSVYNNISFALKLAKTPKDEIDRRVREASAILELDDQLTRKPGQLSGGQRQRVAMGRAIVRQPSVFLMDEPLSNLDAKLRVQMRAEIAKLQRDLNATTIYVTHDQVEAMTMGDRVAVIKDGILQQVDTPQDLYDNPDNVFVAAFIGSPSMNLYTGTLETDSVMLGTSRLAITPALSTRLPHLQRYVGSELIIGIRPEDLHDPVISPEHPADRRLTSTIQLVESLGSEIMVHFSIDAPRVHTGDPDVTEQSVHTESHETTNAIARFSPRSQVRAGSPTQIAVDTDRIHYFDPETHLAIRP